MKIAATISITGIKPLLINTFPIDTLSKTKSKSGTTGDDSYEWKRNVLMEADRELYVYGTYLRGCLITGGKQIKVGRGTLKAKVESTIEVDDKKLMLGRYLPPDEEITRIDTDSVYLDVRSVTNPMTKGRNVRYRVAVSPGWELQAVITWDDSVVSFDDMKQCAKNGGAFEGIGDGRRLGFGRFEITEFKRIT